MNKLKDESVVGFAKPKEMSNSLGSFIITFENRKINYTIYTLLDSKWLLLNNKNVYVDNMYIDNDNIIFNLIGNNAFSQIDIDDIKKKIYRFGFFDNISHLSTLRFVKN